jgi:hypothetical protein
VTAVCAQQLARQLRQQQEQHLQQAPPLLLLLMMTRAEIQQALL